MPDFSSRYPRKLEGCMEVPFAKFGGVHLYRGLMRKATAMFYFCIKDHPFENGNKRYAVVAMLYLLYINGYWLNTTPTKLHELAIIVAETDLPPKVIISGLCRTLKPLVRELPESEKYKS